MSHAPGRDLFLETSLAAEIRGRGLPLSRNRSRRLLGIWENDQGHRRTVVVANAVRPVAQGILTTDELVADGRVPLVPLVSARSRIACAA